MHRRLLDALADRPLLLDGGMGTRLMARGLDLAVDDPALWNLSHPEAVLDIHARDVAAGSDGVLTNTFGANLAWLDRFGRSSEMAAINRRAVALAREAAGPDRFVLGSIGPTAADRAGAYRAQAEALAEAGVDGLVLETHNLARALAGLGEIREGFPMPIVVSLCSLEATIGPLADAGADVLGVNCVHPERARAWVEEIGRSTALPLAFRPGAAHPEGPAIEPEAFADLRGLGRLVRLVGGCCGATEAHVAAMRQALDRARADRV